MKLATTVLVGAAAVNAMHLKASPGAIGGAAPGSEGAIGSASSAAYGAATSGMAGSASAGLMSTLKNLISEISSANQLSSTAYGAGSAAGASAGAGGNTGAGADGSPAAGTYGGISGDEGLNAGADAAAMAAAASLASGGSAGSGAGDSGSAQSKFVQGQMLHFGAANVMEHPEEVEVENAIRAGMATPSQVGPYPLPELSSELSREYPTSFMKLDPSSLMSAAKLSPGDIDAISASVAADTNQFITRASGCGACPSGINYGSCPADYTESRAGECTPSPSYKGLCSRPIDISSFTETDKDMMEVTCSTCFKCN